jgi:hypothetical protein
MPLSSQGVVAIAIFVGAVTWGQQGCGLPKKFLDRKSLLVHEILS